MDNRRQDKRLHLPDLQIKVKKAGLAENNPFTSCKPVDVSFNGLAFASDSLELELLQKIEIRLSVGHKVIEGSAVICHIEQAKGLVRYGVLYIDIKPSLEETFSLDNLSSVMVEDVAINMADIAVIGSASNETDVLIKKAQIVLFDAVQAFKFRLISLVGNVSDANGNNYPLDDLFEFSPSTMSVTVPLTAADGFTLEKRTLSPVMSPTKNKVVFEASDGEQFDSILDVLQSLSDTFQTLLSE
jgi:hypothetical protein